MPPELVQLISATAMLFVAAVAFLTYRARKNLQPIPLEEEKYQDR